MARIDMWALINRELANIERARGGGSEPSYYGAIKEGMAAGTQQKAWNERKNAQMQKMMDLQVEGYQTNFGEADIQKKTR